MTRSKCPVCGCKHFYVKDPDDEYDIHAFECVDGEIRFEDALEAGAFPDIQAGTETFCHACAWHDRFDTLK